MRPRTFSIAILLALAFSVAAFGTPAKADDPSRGPSFRPASGHDYYPWKAKMQGITGRVGLECSIDVNGRAENIVVLESGGAVFDEAAMRLLHDAHFRIPTDWSATGGPANRFRYGLIFRLAGKPDVARFDDGRDTLIITSVPGR